jgi:hypothetical protein
LLNLKDISLVILLFNYKDENTKKEFEMLEKLIDDHEVIFLLTDTRESRW